MFGNKMIKFVSLIITPEDVIDFDRILNELQNQKHREFTRKFFNNS